MHAILGHRLAHRLWTRGWRYPARLLSFAVRLFTNVDIHPGAVIGRRFFYRPRRLCGDWRNRRGGRRRDAVSRRDAGAAPPGTGKRHPTLSDGVVVGAGAKILGPIVVGPRVRVGPFGGDQDVPEDATVVGVPGRVVTSRRQARKMRRRGWTITCCPTRWRARSAAWWIASTNWSVSWRYCVGKRRRILTTATVAPVRPATCAASMWMPPRRRSLK